MKLFYNDINLEVYNIFLAAGVDCLDEIELTSEDSNYYYYIDYGSTFTNSPLNYFNRNFNDFKSPTDYDLIRETKAKLNIPELVYQKLSTGHARLIIDFSKEGHYHPDWYHTHKLFNMPEENLVWITGDKFINETKDPRSKYSFTFMSFWESAVANHFTNDGPARTFRANHKLFTPTALKYVRDLIVNKKVKKYHNIFYNRRPRTYRIELLVQFYHNKMLDDMIWSWGGFNFDDVFNKLDQVYVSNLHKKFGDEYKASIDTVLSWDQLKNYKKQVVSEELVLDDLSLEDVSDTYYRLVTETYTIDKNMFLTEKTYKSMLLYQPFVIWGSPYSIKTLREDGYKTFDKWIDHSYDSIENFNDRRDALVSEVRRLNSISKEEWAEMCFEMLPHLDYNYKHLMNYASRYSIDNNFQIKYKCNDLIRKGR